MTVQHKHLIVRAEVNQPPTDQKWAHTWLTELVSKIGMQICQGPITTYLDMPGNRGLTGLVIIETSHIALHCWDESEPGLMQDSRANRTKKIIPGATVSNKICKMWM